jgi:hypothetical protein
MKNCKECPWVVKNNHNNNLINNINRLYENNSLSDTIHNCHMKNSNIWDKSDKNKCIGSILNNEKLLNIAKI